jgi:hypothetical protein
MKKSGLTLMEILLTSALMIIFLSGAYKLSDARRNTIQAIQANNFAMFAVESLKNQTLSLIEQGAGPTISGEWLEKTMIKSKNWKVAYVYNDPGFSLRLTNRKSAQKRSFYLEVPGEDD